MLPKLRRVGPLVGALLTGTVATFSVLTTGVAVVGCTDENAPETHVERLKDPVRKQAAAKRLIQFYEDAMTRDKKDREGPHVKPLLKLIVAPLAEAAKAGDLPQKTQGMVLSFLADSDDPAAVPALVKALDDYKMDDRPGEQFDANMADVVRGLGRMKPKEAAPALIKFFDQFQHSWPKAKYKGFYRILRDTMLDVADPSWESQLIAKIERPIKTLDQKQLRAIGNELFWQIVSSEVLGKLESKKAVIPLIKVVLSPFKANVHVTAISALIKIGKPAIDEGVKLLQGEHPDLMKYAEEENLRAAKDKDQKVDKKAEKAAADAYKGAAAIIVANIGRKECVEPMLAVMQKGDFETKAVIARELHKLPADDKLIEAFKGVWSEASLTASIPPGMNAKEALSGAAGSFFDAGLAAWVAEQSMALKGEEADTGPIQESALSVLMKLAGKKEWPLVEKLAAIKITYPQVSTLGKSYEKELKASKELIDKCGDDVGCWTKILTSSEGQEGQGFKGIKAAYMIAALGGGNARKIFVESIPRIGNAAVKFVAVSAIDRLSPSGNKETADALQKIVDKAHESKNDAQISAVAPLKTVIYRLRARAQ